jgi:hypothetical protein
MRIFAFDRKRLLSETVITNPAFEDFKVKNEALMGYSKGSKERRLLESSLKQYLKQTVEVPIVIGDKEYTTDKVMYQVVVSYDNGIVFNSERRRESLEKFLDWCSMLFC